VAWQARDLDEPRSPAAARVGDVVITVADVERQARASGADARAALEELVRFELLAAEARRHGVGLPSVRDDEIRAAMVRRLLARELEPTLRKRDVPEAELRARYEENRNYFEHGRLVEVQMLALFVGRVRKESKREQITRDAAALAAFVAAHPPQTNEEFAAIAEQREWADRGVMTMRKLQTPPGPGATPFGSPVADAIHALSAPGQMTKLMSDADGYYIARYLSERPAKHVSFEAARAEIVEKYYEVWRQQRFAALAAQLGRKYHAEVFAERLTTASSPLAR
jgi:hypothetical protein